MRGILNAAFGIGLVTASLSVQAQTGCLASGNELVFLGAGGRAQIGPPQPLTPAQAAMLPPQGIYAACLDVKSGKLASLGIQAKANRPSWVVVDPKKAVVYTTGTTGLNQRDPGAIFSFKIDRATGGLQPLGTSPSGGSDPTHLAWDPHSGTLFVANHGEGVIGVIKTGADGSVSSLSDKAQEEGSGPSPRQKNAEAHGVAVDPTGRFVVSADFGADKLYVYRYDAATGKLSPSTPAFLTTPAGTGPRHITFTPDGKYVVMNTELDGQVRVYWWNEKAGTLTPGQIVDPYPADYKLEKSAAEIEFSRDGKFFYLSLRGKEDKLLVYAWNSAEGKLTEVQRIPSAGGTPWSFALDPTGKWFLVANSASNGVSVFSVAKGTGKLTPVGEPMPLPAVQTLDFLAH